MSTLHHGGIQQPDFTLLGGKLKKHKPSLFTKLSNYMEKAATDGVVTMTGLPGKKLVQLVPAFIIGKAM